MEQVEQAAEQRETDYSSTVYSLLPFIFAPFLPKS
jgi:hypothetical protein